MSNLQLSLKTKWFEMTKARIKKEDYRQMTPYWCNRFLLVDGVVKNKEWWVKFFRWYKEKYLIEFIGALDSEPLFSFKKFDYNIMTLGYPKSGDSERILKLEHKGIEIRNGNPDWGAEPDKLYFVILHGSVVE